MHAIYARACVCVCTRARVCVCVCCKLFSSFLRLCLYILHSFSIHDLSLIHI